MNTKNYIVQLERSSKDISQIAKKLNSYVYEPTTKDLFEKKNSLSSKINTLKHVNSELIHSAANKQVLKEMDIMAQVNEILLLKTEFKAYQNISKIIQLELV